MGRIKTALIKRVTKELVREHRADLKTDFTENKTALKSMVKVGSKKMRNTIAGYVTRIMKVPQTD